MFRSKSYIKLQASSEEEAEEWAAAIDAQFAHSLKEKRFEEEVRFLYKGGDIIMHSEKKGRQLATLRLAKDRGRMIVEDSNKELVIDVCISEIRSVVTGKETDVMKSDAVQAFSSNCFSLVLAGGDAGGGVASVDFEAQSEGSRNRWVSALEVLAKECLTHYPPNKGLHIA